MPINWSLSKIAQANEFICSLKKTSRLEPVAPNIKLTFRGLAFPTVSICQQLGVSNHISSIVVGRQEFYYSTLSDVEFIDSDLSYSTWNNCHFENVTFEESNLSNTHFFGCEFKNCRFYKTKLCDASFSTGHAGVNSALEFCQFDTCNLQGSTNQNLALNNVLLRSSKINKLVFNCPDFIKVAIIGSCEELSLQGDRAANEIRSCPELDLSNACLTWLHANHGVDLSKVRVPANGSSLIVSKRLESINILCEALLIANKLKYHELAALLGAIFSNKSPSPLSKLQDHIFISTKMLQELDETIAESDAAYALELIKNTAAERGILVAPV